MKRILKKLLIVLIILIIVALLYLFVSPLLIGRSSAQVENSSKWMARAGDDMLISELYIPGTHDSGSNYADLAYFSKCQASSIKTQLEDGYRYLDVRLEIEETKSGSRLIFCHGFCKCRKGPWPWSAVLELEDVLRDCYAFLDANPTETIVFAVKMEQGSDTEAFQKLLHEYIDKEPDRWYLSDTIPRLAECRGRLVLFRRYEDACSYGKKSGIQLFWADQGGKDDTSLNAVLEQQDKYKLIVQDRYKYNAADKWNAFLAGLDYSGMIDADLRISFLSTNGTPKFGHPYSYAKVLNRNFAAEDISRYVPTWMILDFSNAVMAEKVYDLNFK